jgi:hypothetical protein
MSLTKIQNILFYIVQCFVYGDSKCDFNFNNDPQLSELGEIPELLFIHGRGGIRNVIV